MIKSASFWPVKCLESIGEAAIFMCGSEGWCILSLSSLFASALTSSASLVLIPTSAWGSICEITRS
jgi:hypothetical protein